ncbi:MAG: cell division protein ZapA [Acidobacteriota bacterium]|nr:cell division protein ZapA [Acidobacteriota bacterium]
MAEPRVVQVEVHGQKYPIRTQLDPQYVEELAAFVEQRMRLAANTSPSSDIVGLAILAALNITDEFFRTRNELTGNTGTLAARTAELEKIVDQALALAE